MKISINWDEEIERLNESPEGCLVIRMGSPGSAQVTRCRLLATYNNLKATTIDRDLFLALAE